eukprot:scaffold70117_cov17-Tisochrysis_lutea.AAC.1
MLAPCDVLNCPCIVPHHELLQFITSAGMMRGKMRSWCNDVHECFILSRREMHSAITHMEHVSHFPGSAVLNVHLGAACREGVGKHTRGNSLPSLSDDEGLWEKGKVDLQF